MTAILGSFAGYLHALLRIVAGYGYFLHGAQKIFGVLGAEQPMPIMSLMGAAGSIELVGGALIALGLFTPWVAFIASGEMAFAYFMGHVARSGGALFPVTNQGEAAVLYCFIFLYLAAKGTGPFGLEDSVPLSACRRPCWPARGMRGVPCGFQTGLSGPLSG